jgi:GNAT superfamily N-acetyltransferase
MFGIKYATQADKDFWFTLDRHITMQVYDSKVRDMQAYVIYDSDKPMGVLRYNLFWDNTPFCNLIELQEAYYGKGFGTQAMKHWENEMQTLGYSLVITSTQANEQAQHFYLKLGYKDTGCLLLNDDPAEVFFIKHLCE